MENHGAAAGMSQPGRRAIFATLAVLMLFAAVYFGSAFSPSLQDDADSTHAEAAREMFVSGDYVTLHVNGIRYLEKAPLMYWLVAASYHVFGVDEYATHLPTVLAMCLLVLLALHWATRAFGARGGTYAGLFVATAAGYYLFSRILIPEAILSLLIATSLYCFTSALETDGKPWHWYGGYAMLALAVLTKGLLALVVVGGAIFVYLLWSGDWRRWREFHMPTGLLLLVAIAAPWHILAGIRNPRFFWFYFVNEHFLRFLGKRYPMDYNKLPASLYWTLHLVWLFPWSVFVPVAAWRMVRRFRREGIALGASTGFRHRTQLICGAWAAVMLVFFAFSTNQEYYTMPAYFPLLVLLACTVAGAEIEQENGEPAEAAKGLLWTAGAITVVSIAASIALAAGLWASRNLPFVADIGSVLAKPDLKADTLSMGHILDLSSQSFAALRLPAILAAIALAVGPLAALVLRWKRRNQLSTWMTAATMAIFLIAAHIALIRFDPYLSSKTLADSIARNAAPQDRVMIYGDQAFGSSLLFYLRRPIELVNGRTTSMWFGSTYPDAPNIFRDDAGLVKAWGSGQRVFLFVPEHQRAKVDGVITGQKFIVGETSGKVVYSNRPGRP